MSKGRPRRGAPLPRRPKFATVKGEPRPRGRPTKYDPEKAGKLLKLLRVGMPLTEAVKVARVCRDTVYEWDARGLADLARKRQTPLAEFSDNLGAARGEHLATLLVTVAKALQTDEEVDAEHAKAGKKKRAGDWRHRVQAARAAQGQMRLSFPKLYQDRQRVTHEGPNGEPLPPPADGIPLEDLDEADLDQLAAIRRRAEERRRARAK